MGDKSEDKEEMKRRNCYRRKDRTEVLTLTSTETPFSFTFQTSFPCLFDCVIQENQYPSRPRHQLPNSYLIRKKGQLQLLSAKFT